MNQQERLDLQNGLHQKNIFIQLPQEYLDRDEVISHLEKVPKKFINIPKLNAILLSIVFEDQKGWESINPNEELLQSGDDKEYARVMVGVSKRKFQMQAALRNEVTFEERTGSFELLFRGEPVSASEGNPLVGVIAQSKVAQELIWEWVRLKAQTE